MNKDRSFQWLTNFSKFCKPVCQILQLTMAGKFS